MLAISNTATYDFHCIKETDQTTLIAKIVYIHLPIYTYQRQNTSTDPKTEGLTRRYRSIPLASPITTKKPPNPHSEMGPSGTRCSTLKVPLILDLI